LLKLIFFSNRQNLDVAIHCESTTVVRSLPFCNTFLELDSLPGTRQWRVNLGPCGSARTFGLPGQSVRIRPPLGAPKPAGFPGAGSPRYEKSWPATVLIWEALAQDFKPRARPVANLTPRQVGHAAPRLCYCNIVNVCKRQNTISKPVHARLPP
jgi:hypothetical protein